MDSWELSSAEANGGYSLDTGLSFSMPDTSQPLSMWGTDAAASASSDDPWNTSGQQHAAAGRFGGAESWTTPGATPIYSSKMDDRLAGAYDAAPAAVTTHVAQSKASSSRGSGARTGGKKRKKALKLGPKRPMSSYFFFTNKSREQLKLENPTLSVTELSKVFGKRWAVLSEAQKAEFVALAEADKERYAIEMKKWTLEHPDEVEAMAQQKKLGRASKRQQQQVGSTGESPRRALSAYSFFLQKMRARVKRENPGVSFGELSKLLGTMWKGLDERQKQVYEDLAATDRTRHEQEQSRIDSLGGAGFGGYARNTDDSDDDDDDD